MIDARHTRQALYALLVLLFATSVRAEIGDVDLSGTVNNADEALIRSHLLGATTLTGTALQNADVNQDSVVDIADAVRLRLLIDNPTPSPSPSPTASPTPSLSPTPTASPTPSLTPSPTASPTSSPQPSTSPTPTISPTFTPGTTQFESSSPTHGEGNVAVTRELILTFNGPIAPASVTSNSIRANFGAQELNAMRHVSPDGRTVTLFFNPFLPGSSRIRVTLKGDLLRDLAGNMVDVDGDGQPAGERVIEYDTLSLASFPGTAVCGRVFASELMPGPDPNQTVNMPLAGVRISVAGADSQIFTVTDALGNFRLDNAPAGRFFVHIDGRTVTSAVVGGQPVTTSYPNGPYYPLVGKPWTSTPGEEVNVGEVYLPLVGGGTLSPVSQTQDTEITFTPEVIAANPALDGVTIHVPADSLYSDDGTRGGMVGIAPVAPDRIPSALPDGLEFPIVITVQTDGASNFDRPVPVCFPNLPDPVTGQPLQPGDKSALWSFNHDSGQWEVRGSMTVNQDGTLVCSDPGVGITYPGWHGSRPGCQGYGGNIMGPASQNNQSANNSDCPEKPKNPTDPVSLFSGEFTEEVVDLIIPGRGTDFIWSRKYNSRIGPNTVMGNGWDFAFNMWIGAKGADIAVYDGSGREDLYRLQTDGTWVCREFFNVLSKNPDESYTLLMPNKEATDFLPLNGSASAGRLKAMRDRNGNQLTFDYNGQGRLIGIHDTLDSPTNPRVIQIAYNASGRISSVTDFIGRQVRYDYYQNGDAGGSAGDLKSVTSPAVTGSVTGNDFPNGKTVTYTYSKGFADERLNHNLLTITDGRRNDSNDPTHGQGPILRNVYGSSSDPDDPEFDKVVEQVWGDAADKIEITYIFVNPSTENGNSVFKTIVNDRVGNVKEYFYDRGNRMMIQREYTGRATPGVRVTDSDNRPSEPLRATDPEFFETRYEYNADSQQKRIVHPNGNITEYVYESELDPNAPRRSRGNLRVVRRLPGDHAPVGDQAEIEDHYEYQEGLGGCCGFNFVTAHTDPRGAPTTYTYDANGNLTKIENRIASIVEEWEYNSFGQVTAHVLPDNGSGTRRRDEFDYHTTGPQTGYLQAMRTDSEGLNLTVTFEYDAVGNIIRTVDARGNDTQFVYNSLNQLLRRISPETTTGSGVRHLTDFSYDANNNVTRIDVQNVNAEGEVDPNSAITTTMEYETLNRISRKTREVDENRSVVMEFEYDANRNQVLARTGEAVNGAQPTNTITTVFDERDLPFRVTRAMGDPSQSTVQLDFDGNQNLILQRFGIEGSPRVAERVYDSYNRLVSMTDPMGNISKYQYDANGNPTHERYDGELVDVPGSAGNVRLSEKTNTYDPMDRLTRVSLAFFDPATQAQIDDGASTTDFTYSDNSQLLSMTNDNGNVFAMGYDTVNRRASTIDPKGNRVTITYDANGNVTGLLEIEKSDLGGADQLFTSSFVFDNLDRRTRQTDSSGNVVDFGYDSRNNVTRISDARRAGASLPGNITTFVYDGLDRLITTQRALTADGTGAGAPAGVIETSQTWDDNSRLVSAIDDNGNATVYEYDAHDRVISETSADGSVRATEYDVHGSVISATDPNGTVVTGAYDALRRLIGKVIAPGPGVSGSTTAESYSYDGQSRLILAENDAATVARAYDSLSQMTRETINGESAVATWDGAGNLVSLVYPGGRTINRAFDALERVATVSDPVGGMIAAYAYVGPDRVARREYGNGTRTQYGYDGIDGVPNPSGDLGVKRVISTTHTVIASSGVIDSRSYLWDAEGNKTRRVDTTPGGPMLRHDYSYDSVHRMTRSVRTPISGPAVTIDYTLDGANNRTQVTGGPDPGAYTLSTASPSPADAQVNQYTTTPFDTRSYDLNGNLAAIDAGQASERSFSYDYRNLMTNYAAPAAEVSATYAYDAVGRRISKEVSGPQPRSEYYFYFGSFLIEEQDGAGATVATYVHGVYLDEILQMSRGGQDYFFHSDDLYNVVKLTDASGAFVESYEYGDFGEPGFFNAAGQPIAGSAVGNPWLFTGRQYDGETGLYLYRSRYADPRVGRFTSRDSIGNWGDPMALGNAFTYTANSPFTFVDPFGLSASQTAGSLLSATGMAWDLASPRIWKEADKFGDAYKEYMQARAWADKIRAVDPKMLSNLGNEAHWAQHAARSRVIQAAAAQRAAFYGAVPVKSAFTAATGVSALISAGAEATNSMNTSWTGAGVRVAAVGATNGLLTASPVGVALNAGSSVLDMTTGALGLGQLKAVEVFNQTGRALGVVADAIFADDYDCHGRPTRAGWKSAQNFVNQAKSTGGVVGAIANAGEKVGDSFVGDLLAKYWFTDSKERERGRNLDRQIEQMQARRR